MIPVTIWGEGGFWSGWTIENERKMIVGTKNSINYAFYADELAGS